MMSEPHYRHSLTIGFYSGTGRGRGFYNPYDVAISREGTMYVLSRGAEELVEVTRVTMCNLDEDFLGEFSMGGNEDGQLKWPVAIALDSKQNVYVSDEALNRISIWDKAGEFLGKWGIQGNGYGQFEKPSGIVFDHSDNLLVVDSGNNRIQRYTREGACLGQWGRGGRGDGEFDLPWGINVDHNGHVYVADWRNDRVQKFDSDGRHLASWGTSGHSDGEFDRPAGVAVDNEGNIFVADWGNQRVQLLGPNGRFSAKFRGEAGVSKWAKEYLDANPEERDARLEADMVPSLDTSRPDFLSYESMSVEKYFWGPTSIRIDDAGMIYVTDSLRHRIEIYTSLLSALPA